MKFSEIELNKNIQKALVDLKFKTLTPIQEKAIPYLLEYTTDLIALAQTGTGKTAAFGLPILQKINIKQSAQMQLFFVLLENYAYKFQKT